MFLNRATLVNWIYNGATALVPIQTAIGDAIKQHPVIGLDDTWIRVLNPGAGKRTNHDCGAITLTMNFTATTDERGKDFGQRNFSARIAAPLWPMRIPDITDSLRLAR